MVRDAVLPGLRLSLFFGAIFAAVGLYLPFWPVWLRAQGLGPEQIGLILAVPTWVKVVGTPLFARLADHWGDRRGVMIPASLLATAAFALYAVADGFWALFGVAALAAFFVSPLTPLGDSLAMLAATVRRLDYGRMRLWGSITFILAAMGGGRLLEGRGEDVILWGILTAYGLTFLTCLALPRIPRPEPTDSDGAVVAAQRRPLRHMLARPGFLLFLVTASLIQASHAVLYGFGTLHWRAAGLDGTVIGWLWAEGVIAEIVLFAFSGAVVRWLGPTRLLMIAAAAAAMRWAVFAETASLPVLVAMQVLHGLTFGAAHVGAMHFIARAAPANMAATAQVLYSSVAMGLAFGLAMPAAGWLYGSLGGGAFHVMAAAGALATLCAIALHRQTR